jgi:hypothetical protein
MFTRTKQFVKSNSRDATLFIDGYDQTNSQLLYKLDNEVDRIDYTITKYENRIDLIAEDIYGQNSISPMLTWILLYINKCNASELVRGKVLQYIELERLQEIIDSL